MDVIGVVLGVVVGLIGGALVALAVSRSQSTDLRAENERKTAETDQARHNFEEARDKVTEAEKKVSGLQATLNAERDAKAEQIKLLQGTIEDFEKKFKSVATIALQENNKAFVENADLRLKPLEDQLKTYEENLQKLRVSGAIHSEQVSSLLDALKEQRKLATDIKGILRGPTHRGRVGELMLEVLLERAGLFLGTHYEIQPPSETESGRKRPDCKVYMPGGSALVVDSKTPLDAYQDAQEAEDEKTRATKLVEHARKIRDAIDDLASREYKKEAGRDGWVVMYLPIEASHAAALNQDPKLGTYGWDKGIIVATPTLMYVLLHLVASTWKQEELKKNTEEVSELGKELLTRVRLVATKMNSLGDHLSKAVKAYNGAVANIDSHLMATAKRFNKLGVSGDSAPLLKEIASEVDPFKKPELAVPPTEAERATLTDLFLETVEPELVPDLTESSQ